MPDGHRRDRRPISAHPADELAGAPVRTYATSADRLRKLAVRVQQ